MGVGRPLGNNLAAAYNSVYNITEDLSGWDKTTIQVISPMSGTAFIYGTNDGGALQGVRQGDASNATNFSPIQATKLSDGTKVNSIAAAGLYEVDVNAQFLRLQANPAAAGSSIYRLLMFNSKIG